MLKVLKSPKANATRYQYLAPPGLEVSKRGSRCTVGFTHGYPHLALSGCYAEEK
jgi:hypothetical protein